MRWILIALAVIFIGACGGSNQSSGGQPVSDTPNTATATTVATVATVDLRCPAQVRESFIQDAAGILEKFTDAYVLASSTSRSALSPIVGEMQALKREMDALDPTGCGEMVKANLVDGMSTIIDGFLAFMEQRESDSRHLLTQGQSTLNQGMVELSIWQVDPSYIPPPEFDGICHHPSEGEALVGQRTCVCGTVTQSIGLWFEMENENSLQLYVGGNEYLPRVAHSVKACGLFTTDTASSPVKYRLEISRQRNLTPWEK